MHALRPIVVAAATLFSISAQAETTTITKAHETKRPSIAADAKGGLHVAYEAYESGNASPDIFCASSGDGGKTWSEAAVCKTPGVSADPAICAEKGGALDVVWTDIPEGEKIPDIYVARSTDGGKTWSKPVDVSKTPGMSSQPAIASGKDGQIVVVWCDTSAGEASPDVWESESMDGGATWTKAVDLSNTPGVSSQPAVAASGDGSIDVIWSDTSDGKGDSEVFHSRSSDGGKTWSKATNISNSPGASTDPDIAVDGHGAIFVSWADADPASKSPDIYVAISRDGGKTFSAPANVSKTPGVSSDPALAIDGDGNVAVIWADTSAGESEPDIWVAISNDSGKTFGKAKNMSNTPGVSKLPDVTIARGRVYTAFEEVDGGKSAVEVSSAPLK